MGCVGRRFFVLSGLAALATPACAGAVEDEIADLRRRVSALEAAATAARAAAAPPAAGAAPDSASKLHLVTWEVARRKGDFGDFYRISYTLGSDYAQAIKLIDGEIEFADLLGEKMYAIRVNKDLAIAPGKPAMDVGDYRINSFLPGEARLGQVARADVAAKLLVRALVFADNSVVKFPQ